MGAYSNVFLSNEQAAISIADKRIRGVALTGSERAGQAIASEAGQALKKSTMELGGSDAFIVLDDADMDTAIKWGVWGKMNNTGECYCAAKRSFRERVRFLPDKVFPNSDKQTQGRARPSRPRKLVDWSHRSHTAGFITFAARWRT